MESLLNIPFDRWPGLMAELGGEPFRAVQVRDWVFKNRVSHFSKMSNLPAPLRKALEEKFTLRSLVVHDTRQSKLDGTIRYNFKTEDGRHFPAVYLPYEKRHSLCLSTQIGCAWECLFCASGQVQFRRNLTAAEMLDQIFIVEEAVGEPLDSLLFMGMGEPLANFANLVSALRLIRSPLGLNRGARHVTVSTCGLVPQIKMLAEEAPKVNLAISLHAVTDEVRKKILPKASSWTIKELLQAAKYFSMKTNARVTFEYLLLEGVNDSETEAKRLANLIRRFAERGDYRVNLIAYNPVPKLSTKRPEDAKIGRFQEILTQRKVPVRLRKPQGVDIGAGCGQLGEAR